MNLSLTRAIHWCCLLSLGVITAPLSASPPAQSSLPEHVTCISDIRYGDGPDQSNLLDLYLPDRVDHTLPLIVWIHGGGWASGDKRGCPAIPLAAHGFVVASLNYRLSGQAQYPAQIQDCKGAIRFLRAHADEYHIDASRVGAWGASAGGHLVALLGTSGGSDDLEGNVGGNLDQSSRVQAVCDWYGPTDLTQFADEAQAAGIILDTPGPPLIMKLFGGSLEEKKDLVRLSNPIAFINGKNPSDLPAFLIMHGEKDKMVPVAQSKLLCDALKTAGATTQMQVIPNAGHGYGFGTPEIARTVLEFFQNTLSSTGTK